MSLLLDALRKAEQALQDTESENDSGSLPESIPDESVPDESVTDESSDEIFTYSAADSDLEQNKNTDTDLRLDTEEALTSAISEANELGLDEESDSISSTDIELSLDKKTLDDAVAQSSDENLNLNIEDTVLSKQASDIEDDPSPEPIMLTLADTPANPSEFDEHPAFRSVIFDDGTPYSERKTKNNYHRPAIAFFTTLGIAALFTYIYFGLDQAKNNETTQADTTLAKAYNPVYQTQREQQGIKNSIKVIDTTLPEKAIAKNDKTNASLTTTDSKMNSQVKTLVDTSTKKPENSVQSASVESKVMIHAHNEHSTVATTNNKATDKPLVREHSETDATVNLTSKLEANPADTGNNQPTPNNKIIHIKKSLQSEPVAQELVEAFRLYHAKQWQKARLLYQKVLALDSKNRDALLGLAAIAIKQKNYSLASGYYQSLLKIDPKDTAALTGLMASGSHTANVRSIAYIKQIIRNNPEGAHLHFSLGNMYATRGRWMEAQNAYFTAYRLDSGNAIYVLNLAISLDQLGQAKAALNYYRLTLRLKQNSIPYANRKTVKKRIKELEKNHLSYSRQSQTHNRLLGLRH